MSDPKEATPVIICRDNAANRRVAAEALRRQSFRDLERSERLDDEAALWERAAKVLKEAGL